MPESRPFAEKGTVFCGAIAPTIKIPVDWPTFGRLAWSVPSIYAGTVKLPAPGAAEHTKLRCVFVGKSYSDPATTINPLCSPLVPHVSASGCERSTEKICDRLTQFKTGGAGIATENAPTGASTHGRHRRRTRAIDHQGRWPNQRIVRPQVPPHTAANSHREQARRYPCRRCSRSRPASISEPNPPNRSGRVHTGRNPENV